MVPQGVVLGPLLFRIYVTYSRIISMKCLIIQAYFDVYNDIFNYTTWTWTHTWTRSTRTQLGLGLENLGLGLEELGLEVTLWTRTRTRTR
jgi:hypothetical protein